MSIGYTDPSQRSFHPCYLAEFGTELLLVANCYGEKHLTINTQAGDIVSLSPTLQNNDFAYIDANYVALVTTDGNISYLDRTLQPANPQAGVLQRANDRLVPGVEEWATSHQRGKLRQLR